MISDNDLLLYYYRDGLDAAERERIAAALSEQPELAARLHRLVARLDAASMTPEVPVPEPVQQRWRDALNREYKFHPLRQAQVPSPAERRKVSEGAQVPSPAERGRAREGAQVPSLAKRGRVREGAAGELFPVFRWRMATAAIAGMLLFVIVKVTMQSMPDERMEQPPVRVAATSANDPSAYQRGLRLHLASTERQLVDLDTASGEERIRLVETIIAQNRLYAIAAERAGEPQLARVLRAFTPVLERVADDRGDAAAGDIAQLNFELNVMQARLAAATSSRSDRERV